MFIKSATSLSTRVDNDRLNMVRRNDAARLAHEVLEPLNTKGAEEVLAGVAVAFAVLSSRFGLGAEGLYNYGLRILKEPLPDANREGYSLVESLKDFANLRVRDDASI